MAGAYSAGHVWLPRTVSYDIILIICGQGIAGNVIIEG